MNLVDQLAQANLDPALLSLLSTALEQGQKDAEKIAQKDAQHRAEIRCKDTKIAALTLELAHHKRCVSLPLVKRSPSHNVICLTKRSASI